MEERRLGLKAEKYCAIITDLTSFAKFGVGWLGVCGRRKANVFSLFYPLTKKISLTTHMIR